MPEKWFYGKQLKDLLWHGVYEIRVDDSSSTVILETPKETNHMEVADRPCVERRVMLARAAPKLLEVLENMVFAHDKLMVDGVGNLSAHDHAVVINARTSAISAIAEAKGESDELDKPRD